MTPDACAAMADTADAIAAEHPDWSGRELLVELGVRVAGIRRGRLSAVGLLVGGRSRLKGGGFRTDLRDHTASQTRHFVGTARAVTVLGPGWTEWLSVHVRRDAPDSPDGRLSSLAIEFAGELMDGSLEPRHAGGWIRRNVCD